MGAGSCLSGLASHLDHLPVQLLAPPEAAVQGACCYTWTSHTDFPFSKCTPDIPIQYTHQALGPSPIGTHTSDPLLQLESNSYNLVGRQRDRLQAGGIWFSGLCWTWLQGSLCCGLCPRRTATLPPPGFLTSMRPRRVPLSHCALPPRAGRGQEDDPEPQRQYGPLTTVRLLPPE